MAGRRDAAQLDVDDVAQAIFFAFFAYRQVSSESD
jgi:hypothetical protein